MPGLDFEALASKYQALALRVAWEFLYREHDVQEVVQEALLACWQRRRKLASEAAFKRLLLGAVVNQCRKRRREYVRHPPEPAALKAAPPAPEEQALASERLAALKKVLYELADEEREALLLCLVEGVSYDEAAIVLDTTIPALRNRLYRARKTLRQKMQQYLG